MTDDQKTENPVLTAMLEYAQAMRGDWSDFDGRTLRAVIDGWVRELRQPDPSHDIEWHRRDLRICTAGGGHWCGYWGYCDDECGCAPCAEDRSEQREGQIEAGAPKPTHTVRYRDAITGEYVTAEEAAQRPATTIRETRRI